MPIQTAYWRSHCAGRCEEDASWEAPRAELIDVSAMFATKNLAIWAGDDSRPGGPGSITRGNARRPNPDY